MNSRCMGMNRKPGPKKTRTPISLWLAYVVMTTVCWCVSRYFGYIYICLSHIYIHLHIEMYVYIKRMREREAFFLLSETAVCQRLRITSRWHGKKHTAFLLLQCCWIAEFWTRHGSEWIMFDSCVNKHAADSQAITAAWTMNMDAVMSVSRHIEKAYACTHLHGSMVLMYGKNDSRSNSRKHNLSCTHWARLDVTCS